MFYIENLQLLCAADTVLVDGTFDACPNLFSQLFRMHVFKEERLLPLIYCLLSDKSAATYVAVFGILQTEAVKANLVLQPRRFISDFESGIIRAETASFPNTSHKRLLLPLHAGYMAPSSESGSRRSVS